MHLAAKRAEAGTSTLIQSRPARRHISTSAENPMRKQEYTSRVSAAREVSAVVALDVVGGWQMSGRPDAEQKWRATLDGNVIVDAHRDPEHAACRALLAMGITGRVIFQHASSGTAGLSMDIMHGANLITYDDDEQGLRTRQYGPHLWSGAGRRAKVGVGRGKVAKAPSSVSTLHFVGEAH